MKHVMIFSGLVSRKVTWDQAVDFLARGKYDADTVATLRKDGLITVKVGESKVILSVLPE